MENVKKKRKNEDRLCNYSICSDSLILAVLMCIDVRWLFVCMYFPEDLKQMIIMKILGFFFQKKIIILICLAIIIVILGSMVAGWLGFKR